MKNLRDLFQTPLISRYRWTKIVLALVVLIAVVAVGASAAEMPEAPFSVPDNEFGVDVGSVQEPGAPTDLVPIGDPGSSMPTLFVPARVLDGDGNTDTIAGNNACMNDVYNQFGQGGDLNCTANDVSLAAATNITILDDGCAFPGDTVTFEADFQVEVTAGTRYDVGIYFSNDGDPNGDGALTGQCSVSTPAYAPDPPWLDEDGTTNTTTASNTFGYCSPDNGTSLSTPIVPCDGGSPAAGDAQCVATLGAGYTCEEFGPGIQDTCGDISKPDNSPLYPTVTQTVTCVDDDGDGDLDLPYCTSWRQQGANELCLTPLAAYPGAPSKCNCDPGFSVPITVPAGILVRKEIEPPDAYDGTTIFDFVVSGGSPSDNLPPGFTLPDNDNSPWTWGWTLYPANPGGSDYTVTELPETGWTLVDATCTSNQANRPVVDPRVSPINILPGETYTCVYINSPVTPVTLAHFAATSSGNGVTFDWSTATETANAGFNLYAQTVSGLEQLNETLILSQAVDSMSRLDYSFTAVTNATEFFLEEVDVDGGTDMHGPYALGETFGGREEAEAIDWTAVGADVQAEGARQAGEARAAAPATGATTGLGGKAPLTGQLAYPEFALRVKEDGIYRVSFEDLQKATGVGLLGVPASNLALTNNGQAVPLRVVGGRIMKPGVYLEFVGKALDTLYTTENVYILQVNQSLAQKMPAFIQAVAADATVPAYYMETASFEANNLYSVRATSGDPWYDTLLHTDKPKSWSFSMATDNLVAGAAKLYLDLWGASNGAHHLVAKVNGVPTADVSFKGNGVKTVNAPVSNLKAGANTLELTVPNDRGAKTDTMALEGYGLTYPRAFVARDGRLSFTADAAAFTVSGLPNGNVIVYQDKAGGPQRISMVYMKQAGSGYSATFAGNGAGTYYVSTASAALKPKIALSAPAGDITSGSADLLIISHPNFISGLTPLVQAREAQGYKVKVVDVNAVYRTYSGGVFSAEAIRQYVNHAIKNMGVEYVLLVGADTNDYLGNNGSLAISFVPTLYAQTDNYVYFNPVDPLFTDVNDDNVPDAAIGRFPVRTTNELKMLVDKTLMYDKKSYGQTAVFAADNEFGSQSADLASALGAGWSVKEAYLDNSTVAEARQTLIGSLNQGVALATYFGHSALYNWTGDGLFTVNDAKALTNYGKPAVVTQLGCWNTYYVDPNVNSLGHRLLLSGTNGAVVVSGATVLPGETSEYELGLRMMPLLSKPGTTVGAAIQEAKSDLAQTYPNMLDVLLGYTILGDPTAVVQPN